MTTKKTETPKELSAQIDEIFGSDASDEFKEKAKTIFEAAVGAERKKIEEEVQATIDEQVAEQVAAALPKIEENVDKYLTHIAEEWLEENELAIESGLKVELADSLIEGLVSLVKEHNLEVPEESEEIVEELMGACEALEDKLNEATLEIIELRKALDKIEADKIVTAACEGLTDVQVAKLSNLAEGLVYKSPEDFKKKVQTVKENFFKELTEVKPDAVSDAVAPPAESEKKVDPAMKAYVDAASEWVSHRKI